MTEDGRSGSSAQQCLIILITRGQRVSLQHQYQLVNAKIEHHKSLDEG